MADSAQVRSQLAVFVQKKTAERLKNTLFKKMPLLEFFFALNGDKKGADGLGRPKAGMLAVGRINEASAPNRERLLTQREYLPIIQVSKPSTSEVKSMDDYDSEPTVPNWDTTNAPMKRFKQPRFHFARFKMPYKIPHSELRTAKSGATTEGQAAAAVGTVYDVEVKTRMAVLCEKLNNCMFQINGETGAPVDEDRIQWNVFHSIQKAIDTANVYGGLDRTVAANAFWKGKRVATTFSGSFYDMIDNANYDQGMTDIGLGVQVIVVGSTLMKKAKAEAKAEGYQMTTGGIPEYPEFGFKREVVRIFSGERPVYITYDPAMNDVDTATGKKNAFALDPSTWTVAIHPDANFRVSLPSDQTKVEGGDEADTGTIHAEVLICCEVPSGNVIFEDVQ